MKKLFTVAVLLIILPGCASKQPNNQINMKITSPNFAQNGNIPDKFTCKGQNINPELDIFEVPENTESLVLIVDDPDAPASTLQPGSGQAWTHWTLWNIDPSIAVIKENLVPPTAVEGITSFGKPGYGGPCPPSGTHRYYFKLYSLNTKLDLPGSTRVSDLEKALDGHILDQAELMGVVSK